MRGENEEQDRMFSYRSPADRVPRDHPLRAVKDMANRALKELSAELGTMYAPGGRHSIPPEKLIRALLLQVLSSIRSERMLMEQLDYNLLFRWFVGLSMDDEVWDHSTFSKNREGLRDAEIVGKFFAKIREQARGKGLLSDEHFTVDGTLIEAWASQKSFQPKDGDPQDPGEQGRNAEVDFHDKPRNNETHRSTTDGDARLMKKTPGAEARLGYMGHVLMENGNGLVVQQLLTRGSGTAEREATVQMLEAMGGAKRLTVGADRAYDVAGFVEELRQIRVTPHVAQKREHSAIDKRTVRHSGYAINQRRRKRVEDVFGWMKTVGCYRKTKFRGEQRVGMAFTLAATAYNLVRMRNLTAQTQS
jgi:transposase